MKLRILTFSILLASIIGVFSVFVGNNTVNEVPVQAVQEVKLTETPTVERLLELTNAERIKAGVKPLVLDERLNQSAQRKADELVLEGWDDTPHLNDAGRNTANYIEDSMPECEWLSENLLYNAKDVNVGFNWWMNSPSHKEAILDSRYEYVGYAINNGYVAQHFCDID